MLVAPKAPVFEIDERLDDTTVSIHEIKLKIRQFNQKINPRHVFLKKYVLTANIIKDEYGGDVEAYREDNLEPEKEIPFLSVKYIKKNLKTFISLKDIKKDTSIKAIKKLNFSVKSHCLSLLSWLVDSLQWCKQYSNQPEYRIARETKARLQQKLEWEKAVIEKEKMLIEKSKKDFSEFKDVFQKYFMDIYESAKRLISMGKVPYVDKTPIMNFIKFLMKNYSSSINSWINNKEVDEEMICVHNCRFLGDYRMEQDEDVRGWINNKYLKSFNGEILNINGGEVRLCMLKLKHLIQAHTILEENA